MEGRSRFGYADGLLAYRSWLRGWTPRLLLPPLALVLALFVVYLPSLSGDLLNWDDPWLIERNQLIATPELHALAAILSDFSKPTRLMLGAEFLPVRDLSLWLTYPIYGIDPSWLRLTNLAWYIGAVLFFRGALGRIFGAGWAIEVGAWLFALHPVHVESAAWVSGRKDVLALFFVGAALFVYAKPGAKSWLVSGLVLLAGLSKSMAIVTPALLLGLDLWQNREPNVRVLLSSTAIALVLLFIHTSVGASMGMTTALPGGSRFTAALTMGPVWLRYFELIYNPTQLSVVQEVPVLTAWNLPAILGWLTVFVPFALAGFWFLRHRQGKPLALVLFWFAPLLPVSQVVFPLQNRMADRYLFLSIFALTLALVWVIQRWRSTGLTLGFMALAGFAVFTYQRASLFADSELLFRQATEMTSASPTAPYQLAMALEAKAQPSEARIYYEEVVRRSTDDVGRRATNNLARLYVHQNRLDLADALLEKGIRLWPDDPKMLANRLKVLFRQNRISEAQVSYAQLKARFPNYSSEAEKRAPHVGP